MNNDTQQSKSSTDKAQQTASEELEADPFLAKMNQAPEEKDQFMNQHVTDTVLGNEQNLAKSEEHHLKTSSPNTSFKLEKTPQMGVEHLDKLAPAAVITNVSVANTPSYNWRAEKTLLINDDENVSASVVHMDTKQRFMLDTFPFTIGRTPECQLQLEDISLSRQHARIQKSESGMTIEDLDSANGIKVNDVSINQVLLMDGDIITLGYVKLRFELKNTTQTPQKTQPFTHEFLDKIKLTHPNWKIMTAAGLIGTLLVGTLFYKSQIDDRVIVTELTTASESTAAKPSEQAKTKATTQTTPSEVVANNSTAPATQAPNNIAQSIAPVAPLQSKPDNTETKADTETNTGTSATPTEAVSETTTAPVKNGVRLDATEQHQASSNKTTNKTPTAVPVKPPSIKTKTTTKPSVLANNTSNNSNKSIKSSSKPKPDSKPSLPGKAQSQPVRRSSISIARHLYQTGYEDKAISMLDKLSSNPGLSTRIKNQASLLQAQIETLKGYYQQGLQAYENGNKNKAWDAWTQFILAEKKLHLATKSKFIEIIQSRVSEETLLSGQQNKPSQATVDVSEGQQASQLELNRQDEETALLKNAEVENKVRDLYREGYRLEHTNLSKAIQRWRQVIRLAPSSSEYFTKANAKLRFYEEMNP